MTETNINAEWRLADFLDTLAAEVDLAQDTLSLKSFVRGMTVAIKGLSLDLAVFVRVNENGQVFFRCAEPGQPSPTILKLDLQETFQAQVEEVRKPLDNSDLGLPLTSLAEITEPEIAALHTLSIFTVDDLRRSCATSVLLSEVSRRTGIAEVRLRGWLDLPYLTGLVQVIGSPGPVLVLEGKNLGTQDATDVVFFQTLEAQILRWEESRITVEIPVGARPGPVYARVDGSRSNVLLWQLPLLHLTSVTPTTGMVPSSLSVVLLGTGFQAGASVSLGASVTVGEVAVESTERMTAQVSIAKTAVLGPRDVTVTLLDGRRADTLRGAFTLVPPPRQLSLDSVEPATALVSSLLTVVLKGSGFEGGCTVSFGPAITVSTLNVDSTEQMTAQISIAKTAALGARDVSVIPSSGLGRETLRGGFTLVLPGKEDA